MWSVSVCFSHTHTQSHLCLIPHGHWCAQGVTEKPLLAADAELAEFTASSDSRGHLMISGSHCVAPSFYVWAAILLPCDLKTRCFTAKVTLCRFICIKPSLFKALQWFSGWKYWNIFFFVSFYSSCISRGVLTSFLLQLSYISNSIQCVWGTTCERIHPFVCCYESDWFYIRFD